MNEKNWLRQLKSCQGFLKGSCLPCFLLNGLYSSLLMTNYPLGFDSVDIVHLHIQWLKLLRLVYTCSVLHFTFLLRETGPLTIFLYPNNQRPGKFGEFYSLNEHAHKYCFSLCILLLLIVFIVLKKRSSWFKPRHSYKDRFGCKWLDLNLDLKKKTKTVLAVSVHMLRKSSLSFASSV